MQKGSSTILLFIFCALIPGLLTGTDRTQVEYPKDYRSWTRVKSMVILEGHVHYNAFGGFHHVYANELALAAMKAGRPYPKGSILVFELYQELKDSHAISEGTRNVIGVMEKDPDRFPETAGWGYEDFKQGDPKQRAVTNMQGQCMSCHETQKSSDYVYSTYHE
jgi:hypothetical protein